MRLVGEPACNNGTEADRLFTLAGWSLIPQTVLLPRHWHEDLNFQEIEQHSVLALA